MLTTIDYVTANKVKYNNSSGVCFRYLETAITDLGSVKSSCVLFPLI